MHFTENHDVGHSQFWRQALDMRKLDSTEKHDSNFGNLSMKKGGSFQNQRFLFLFQLSMGGERGDPRTSLPPCVRTPLVLSIQYLRSKYTNDKTTYVGNVCNDFLSRLLFAIRQFTKIKIAQTLNSTVVKALKRLVHFFFA